MNTRGSRLLLASLPWMVDALSREQTHPATPAQVPKLLVAHPPAKPRESRPRLLPPDQRACSLLDARRQNKWKPLSPLLVQGQVPKSWCVAFVISRLQSRLFVRAVGITGRRPRLSRRGPLAGWGPSHPWPPCSPPPRKIIPRYRSDEVALPRRLSCDFYKAICFHTGYFIWDPGGEGASVPSIASES